MDFLLHQIDQLGILSNEKEEFAIGKRGKSYTAIFAVSGLKKPFPRNKNINSWYVSSVISSIWLLINEHVLNRSFV